MASLEPTTPKIDVFDKREGQRALEALPMTTQELRKLAPRLAGDAAKVKSWL